MQLAENFEEWKYCIEVSCGIELTGKFIEQRLLELSDNTNKHTRDFTGLYGNEYKQQVISWFIMASNSTLNKQTL